MSAPSVCAEGAKSGLKICSDILIPAIFPFAVPVLFLIGTQLFINSKHKLLMIFILSTLGGYPIGAKLISQVCIQQGIDKDTARNILPFCVNAGPAFIVVAIGKGLLGSVELGYILLISHILSSTVIALIFMPDICKKNEQLLYKATKNFYENFVACVHEASSACISICAYVVFFSVINEYILYFSDKIQPIGFLLYFTEVTSALKQTDNIYFMSFLLGFAGLSIHMQIFSITSEIRPNIINFIFFRMIHGALSAVMTFLAVKTFKISVAVIGNHSVTHGKALYSDLSLALSLLIVAFLLIININSKKHGSKILYDMI